MNTGIEAMLDDIYGYLYLHVSRKHANKILALFFVLLGWSLAAIVYHVL
jgi:hypothetical protein